MQFGCKKCGKHLGPDDYPICRNCGNRFQDPFRKCRRLVRIIERKRINEKRNSTQM
jgi:uncharacterized membrane protein YvbJ